MSFTSHSFEMAQIKIPIHKIALKPWKEVANNEIFASCSRSVTSAVREPH